MIPTRTLTAHEVESYERDGFLPLGRLLSDDDMAELLEEEQRFRPASGYGSQTLFVTMQLCDVSEPIRRICTRGPQVPMVAQLMGPNVCLTHTQLLTKLPDRDGTSAAIAFHQDNGYGQLEPMTDITVWIAVTAANQENGGLRIVPGSHRAGLVEHGSDDVNRVLRRSGDGEGSLPVDLEPGEGVAFSGLTVHGSGPNLTDRPRVGFYARYCEPGVRMLSEGGRSVLEDRYSWMVAGVADRVERSTAFSDPHAG